MVCSDSGYQNYSSLSEVQVPCSYGWDTRYFECINLFLKANLIIPWRISTVPHTGMVYPPAKKHGALFEDDPFDFRRMSIARGTFQLVFFEFFKEGGGQLADSPCQSEWRPFGHSMV